MGLDLKDILKLYRDPILARRIVDKIWEYSKKVDKVMIMHVCGTHEWTITHYGIRSLLPDNIEVRAGPGCPVCILPAQDIDSIIKLALDEDLTVLSYGDVSRAKGGSGYSLEDSKALGFDLKIVYSIQDAYEIALSNKDRKFIFFGVGFDTTAPSTAYMILKGVPDNLIFLSSYRYVPPSIGYIIQAEDIMVDGIINPGHSSTVTGMAPYRKYFESKPIPMVFSGFEPIDVLISIYMILRQIISGEYRMENEYSRSVTWDGNVKAMNTLFKVFKLLDGLWRGIGVIDGSGFEFKDEFRNINARYLYDLEYPNKDSHMPSGCRCADIIKGKITPIECPLYMKMCRPDKPIGPCMVSIEGTCRIWAEHMILSKAGET